MLFFVTVADGVADADDADDVVELSFELATASVRIYSLGF